MLTRSKRDEGLNYYPGVPDVRIEPLPVFLWEQTHCLIVEKDPRVKGCQL
jgi:hypothetical protein